MVLVKTTYMSPTAIWLIIFNPIRSAFKAKSQVNKDIAVVSTYHFDNSAKDTKHTFLEEKIGIHINLTSQTS